MKILTVVFNLDKGGTQRCAQNFAEAYQFIGHDSRILSLYGLGVRYDEIKDTITIYNGLNSINDIIIWMPDIIHLHSHNLKNDDVSFLLKCCNLSTAIETNVFSRPSPWASKILVSFQLSNWANWIFNLRKGKYYKTAIVPNPIKINNFLKIDKYKEKLNFCNNFGIDINSKIIGRIGQSYNKKWSLHLINIFEDLKKIDNSFHLIVINPPASIISRILISNSRKSITIIDKIIGDENLNKMYAALDLTVLIAEQGESFGMVIAESILSGTPVATLSTPWADNSQCEVSGLFYNPMVSNNLKSLRKNILEYFQKSKEDQNELQINLTNHIITSYDSIAIAKLALENIYINDNTKNDIKFYKILNKINHNYLTNFLLSCNSNILRKFTIFTTGYFSVLDIPIILKNKLFR